MTGESTRAARSKKIPILLITQAYITEDVTKGRRLEDDGLDGIAETQIQSGVLHLSMRNVFEGLDFGLLYADRSHLRPSGHRELAQAIVKKLIDSGIVTPKE